MTTKITEKNISSVANAGVQWQSVIVADGSTTTTGVAGRGYFINTTNAAHTFTLPATATFADTIIIKDYAGTFGTNKLTIARNGHNIQGVANNSQIGTNRASVELVYIDVTRGWEYVLESNVADLQEALFITATGGTVTTSGNFKIHTFTGDGCFVVSQLGNPAGGPSNVDYLVVAGGGAGGPGGGSGGGGAGAGGYRTSFPSPGCNAGSFPVTTTTYPITVGAGGADGTPSARTGSPSIFSTITSAGGGFGGSFEAGGNGGSGGGGGGGFNSGQTPDAGGIGNSPPVSPPQGNPGGTSNPWPSSSNNVNRNGGGGGGAGAAGTNGYAGTQPAPCSSAGSGGIGLANSISGSPVYYAGGGGGAKGSAGPGQPQGGAGGGGNGSYGQPIQTPGPSGASTGGTANTGGGGGGFIQNAPGYNPGSVNTGGKGIVIIRYKFQ